MALINTLIHLTDFQSSPFLSNYIPAVAASYSVQLLIGAPSILRRTEIFYDLAGGLSFLLTLSSSLLIPALRRDATVSLDAALQTWNWRQLALTGAAAVWIIRRKHPSFPFIPSHLILPHPP